MGTSLQLIRSSLPAISRNGHPLNPPWKGISASYWCEGLMEGLGVDNPNAVERQLEPWLFKKDSEGRLHGSGKYRRYLYGEDFPSEPVIELGQPLMRDKEDRLDQPLWRFCDYREPSRIERWEILESLKPGVQAQVLRFLAEVKDPRSSTRELDIRLKAIQLEGGLDSLAGLLFTAMEIRNHDPAYYFTCSRISSCFAAIVFMSRHGYRYWKKQLFPLIVKRYMSYDYDLPDLGPKDMEFIQHVQEGAVNGMHMCHSFAGKLVTRLTQMELLTSSPSSQWAFFTYFHPIVAPRLLRHLRAIEEQGVVKPDVATIDEPLRTWLTVANQYAQRPEPLMPA